MTNTRSSAHLIFPIAAGKQPAWVTFDPSGKFSYVSDRLGSAVSTLSLSAANGLLSPLASETVAGVSFAWPIPA